MTRGYTLKRRAEQQAGTRLKIVEAAVALHGSIGPAQTSVSMIAARAGVQRHTLYAHFPDERSLFLACSGLTMARDPIPDPAPFRAIRDPSERLAAGFSALYGWFERNETLAGCVLRDAEHHALTREMTELHIAPVLARYREILADDLPAGGPVLLPLALSYFTWRTLIRESGLDNAEAVTTMVGAVTGGSARECLSEGRRKIG